MATYFGYQDGAAEDDIGDAATFLGGNWVYGKYACPGSGAQHIQELTADCRLIANSTNIRLAVYDTSRNLVAQGTAQVALAGVYGWKGHIGESTVQNADTTTPAVLTGGVEYILAFSTDYGGQACGIHRFYLDDTATMYLALDYTGGFPASIAAGGETYYEYNIRCGVDDAGGGGRTAMVTRAKPFGVAAGMNFGVQY